MRYENFLKRIFFQNLLKNALKQDLNVITFKRKRTINKAKFAYIIVQNDAIFVARWKHLEAYLLFKYLSMVLYKSTL